MPDYGRADEGLYKRLNDDMNSLQPTKENSVSISATGNRSLIDAKVSVPITKNISVGVQGTSWEGKQYPEDKKYAEAFISYKGKF